MNQVAEDFVEHYGKKGMKWGVRGSRTQVKTSSDFKKTAALRKKKPHELTNKQLQNLNARVKLEQTHRRNFPSKITKGRAAVAGIIAAASTAATIYNLQHNPAVKALVTAGKSRAATIIAQRASKLPYEQLKLFT